MALRRAGMRRGGAGRYLCGQRRRPSRGGAARRGALPSARIRLFAAGGRAGRRRGFPRRARRRRAGIADGAAARRRALPDRLRPCVGRTERDGRAVRGTRRGGRPASADGRAHRQNGLGHRGDRRFSARRRTGVRRPAYHGRQRRDRLHLRRADADGGKRRFGADRQPVRAAAARVSGAFRGLFRHVVRPEKADGRAL